MDWKKSALSQAALPQTPKELILLLSHRGHRVEITQIVLDIFCITDTHPSKELLIVIHTGELAPERVTFHSEESGYTVLRFTIPGERELVTAIGRFPDIHAGQTLRLTGYYREHPKYGRKSVPVSSDSF